MAYEFKLRRRVEFAETDMAQVVHFSQFFRYMEQTEHAFIRSLGFSVWMQVGDEWYGWPRGAASCEFQSPLKFEDEFEVHLLIREVRAKAIVYDFRFTRLAADGPVPVARGSMTTVCIQQSDQGRMRAAPIPSAFAEKIEPAPQAMLQ